MGGSEKNTNAGKNDPKVTVYITNYNYDQFIEQSIQSVLNQTMQDFELIIIDDGSTDNSHKIIEKYASHEKIMTIFQQNKGLNVTNNIALRAARGDYIMRLDADDYLDKNALNVLSGILDSNPDVGLVFPDYFLVDESNNLLEVKRRHDFDNVILMDQPAHGACTMLRRECMLKLDGYDESFISEDGYDLWIRFIQHYKVQNVNLPLFYYRKHPKSMTRNENLILETRARIVKKHTKLKGRHLKAIAVVPVRGRNLEPGCSALRPLSGMALIDWTLQTTLNAKRVSDVLVTTPDEELLSYVSRKYGEDVLLVRRDLKYALPNTYIEDTIFHALKEYTREHSSPDVIAILYIESPFRTPQNIDNALDIMELFDTDTVVAVRPETDCFYKHNGGGLEPLRKAQTLRLETDELYREVGHLHVVRRSFLESKKQVVGGKVGHIVLDKQAAFSVCSEWDWGIAEFIASLQKNKTLGDSENVNLPIKDNKQ